MSSRDAILKDLRRNLPPAVELPDLADEDWITYDDPVAQFREVLEAIGGRFFEVDSMDEADAEIRRLDGWNEGPAHVSLVPGVGETTFDYAAVELPTDLQHVDFAVLPAHFAVAENGAVWVTPEDAAERTLNFLSQHVAYVIDRRNAPDGGLVHTMHRAYELADPRASAFSLFAAGPSKTADIEQSLVIGAHGARSAAVLFVG